MKFLRGALDRADPLFKEGGKFEKLYPVYEALDTFLYTPGEVTAGPSHVRDAMDLKRTMIFVVLALVPCTFMAMFNTGLQANEAMADLGISAAAGWRGCRGCAGQGGRQALRKGCCRRGGDWRAAATR